MPVSYCTEDEIQRLEEVLRKLRFEESNPSEASSVATTIPQSNISLSESDLTLALRIAIQNGNSAADVEVLLQNGALISAKCLPHGRTALWYATSFDALCRKQSYEICNLLINHSRETQVLPEIIDCQPNDSTMRTPLMNAIRANCLRTAELLVCNGADVGTRKNKQGLTAAKMLEELSGHAWRTLLQNSQAESGAVTTVTPHNQISKGAISAEDDDQKLGLSVRFGVWIGKQRVRLFRNHIERNFEFLTIFAQVARALAIAQINPNNHSLGDSRIQKLFSSLKGNQLPSFSKSPLIRSIMPRNETAKSYQKRVGSELDKALQFEASRLIADLVSYRARELAEGNENTQHVHVEKLLPQPVILLCNTRTAESHLHAFAESFFRIVNFWSHLAQSEVWPNKQETIEIFYLHESADAKTSIQACPKTCGEDIDEIMQKLEYGDGYDRTILERVTDEILSLEPFVDYYTNNEPTRPVFISIITDAVMTPEEEKEFRKALSKCISTLHDHDTKTDDRTIFHLHHFGGPNKESDRFLSNILLPAPAKVSPPAIPGSRRTRQPRVNVDRNCYEWEKLLRSMFVNSDKSSPRFKQFHEHNEAGLLEKKLLEKVFQNRFLGITPSF